MHAAAAKVTPEKTYNLLFSFNLWRERVSRLTLKNLVDQLSKTFLPVYGFNTLSPVLGNFCKHGQGKLIKTFLQGNDLILLKF